jgi:nitrite reductase (cytochrome c-552)
MAKYKLISIFLGIIILTVAITGLLISIFEHKQESRLTYLKITDIAQDEPDPTRWKENFPQEYDDYLKTMRTSELADYSKYGRYGGSEAYSKLDKHPDFKRMFAGYPFSVEYREERGHMRALEDVENTKRMGREKPGTCITCKTSDLPGLFKKIGPEKVYGTNMYALIKQYNITHSISCADCHDGKTMELRVTRPAFIEAMAKRGIDVSKASHQEMRSHVCGQCHVEYYFKGPGKYLTFPWEKGLSIDSIEAYYDQEGFKDWVHGETQAPMLKMQHPEFETWSSGIHSRSGVTCTDCHMPYKRMGAVKYTDHWIRTPLENISNACLPCHRQSEEEMKSRVLEIQDKTFNLMNRAEKANIAAIDAINAAMKSGATDTELAEARKLFRRSSMRWDFVNAENSMGFHSPQETSRILGDSIDYARQAEIAAIKVQK